MEENFGISSQSEQANQLHQQGQNLFHQNRFEDALSVYNKAISLVGEKATPWSVYDKGALLRKLGRYQEAVTELSKAQSLIPSASPEIELAETFLDIKDLKSAESAFKSAIVKPASDKEEKESAAEGLSRIEKMRLEGSNYHKQGQQAFHSGRFQEALTEYNKAIETVGGSETPWSVFDSGLASLLLGKFEDAQLFLQSSRHLMPYSPWPAIELAKLSELEGNQE